MKSIIRHCGRRVILSESENRRRVILSEAKAESNGEAAPSNSEGGISATGWTKQEQDPDADASP